MSTLTSQLVKMTTHSEEQKQQTKRDMIDKNVIVAAPHSEVFIKYPLGNVVVRCCVCAFNGKKSCLFAWCQPCYDTKLEEARSVISGGMSVVKKARTSTRGGGTNKKKKCSCYVG